MAMGSITNIPKYMCNTTSIFEPFINPYEDLGAKINKFIEYVDKHWNENL